MYHTTLLEKAQAMWMFLWRCLNKRQAVEVHVINQFGDKRVLKTKNLEKELRELCDSSNSRYHLDIDWYLAHGYCLAEDVRIERKVNKE